MANTATIRPSAVDFRERDTTQQKRAMSTQLHRMPTSLSVTRAEKCTKRKTAGPELMRQTI